jgi:hypothetical protein
VTDGHHADVSAPFTVGREDFVSPRASKVQSTLASGHPENAGLTFPATISPGRVMILQQWRRRLTYAAMSLFVAWHTAATVIAPAPDMSTFIQALRVPLRPYLSLFRLDNMWDFYSPNVPRGSQFRYIIEDDRGNHHPFAPTEKLSWFHPSFFWFRSWFDAVMINPDTYAANTPRSTRFPSSCWKRPAKISRARTIWPARTRWAPNL